MDGVVVFSGDAVACADEHRDGYLSVRWWSYQLLLANRCLGRGMVIGDDDVDLWAVHKTFSILSLLWSFVDWAYFYPYAHRTGAFSYRRYCYALVGCCDYSDMAIDDDDCDDFFDYVLNVLNEHFCSYRDAIVAVVRVDDSHSDLMTDD